MQRNNNNDYDKLITVSVMGAPGSGKTMLIDRMANREFTEGASSSQAATLTIISHTIDNYNFKLQLFDEKKKTRFSHLETSNEQSSKLRSQAVLITMDTTKPTALAETTKVLNDIKEMKFQKSPTLILVPTKIDSEDRMITLDIITHFATENNISIIVEASSKTAENIKDVLNTICYSQVDVEFENFKKGYRQSYRAYPKSR